MAAREIFPLQVAQVHSRVCNNCVEGFDHHCSFLDSCIGRHNYAYFLGFLCSIVLLSISETAGFLIYLFSLVSQKALIGNDYRRCDSRSDQELGVPRRADDHDRHPRHHRQSLRRRTALFPHLPARSLRSLDRRKVDEGNHQSQTQNPQRRRPNYRVARKPQSETKSLLSSRQDARENRAAQTFP